MKVTVAAVVMVMGLSLVGAISPRPAMALGVIINVTTTADVEAADGFCSLREAIIASNGGGYLDCDGSTSADGIRFNIGSGVPVITLGFALPQITQPVTIRGNTNGATRVKLVGGGLDVDYTADGTYIGSMVLPNIYIGGADNVTVVGNVIGPSSGFGISGNGNNLKIGGSNPGTPEPCSGECNLIAGNASGGIYFGSTSATITGNFIGVDATGTAASGNGTGILITSGGITIGGTTPDTRNIVSGNTHEGMVLHACTCVVQGNYVGTDVTGSAAVPNGEAGIDVDLSQASIGGAAAGAANVISGNTGDGIYSDNADDYNKITIEGNRIGTKAGGGALGNGGAGIHFTSSTNGIPTTYAANAVVGSATTPGAGNVIAYNSGAGVVISGGYTRYNEVRGNSIHDNAAAGIALFDSANDSVAAPAMTSTAPLSGSACANCTIDIYSDTANEGRRFEGTVTADGSGLWSYPNAVSGPNVTATATNPMHSTSRFSAPVLAPPTKPDGRIKKGAGSLVGNNIYNTTGANQTVQGSRAVGDVIEFTVSIQNDGHANELFKVRATGAAVTGYRIRYFRGDTEITAAVVDGSYRTTTLSPGATYGIRARVKVLSTAAVGSSVARLVTIRSVHQTSRKDAVKFIAERR